MNENTYNGWPNRETWLVALWLLNEEATALHVGTLVNQAVDQHSDDPEYAVHDLARMLEADFGILRDSYQGWGLPGLYRDLLGTAWARIDWHRLARTWLEDFLEVGA